MSGTLYVVSTPIGHLDDITRRALAVLGEVDWIAAEDTRHSQALMDHIGVGTRLISYHDHNEAQRTPELVKRLSEGDQGALISDAGTPLVSDPGYRLVRACQDAGVTVVPVPGASALLAALARFLQQTLFQHVAGLAHDLASPASPCDPPPFCSTSTPCWAASPLSASSSLSDGASSPRSLSIR